MPNFRLTPDEYQMLQDQDGRISELKAAIAQLKKAGLNVQKLEAALTDVQSRRAGMLKHLAPQAPTVRP